MRVVLRNVCKDIKGARVLDNVNLELESGMVYGFKGKNGSGKTMLMRAISGLIMLMCGKVTNDNLIDSSHYFRNTDQYEKLMWGFSYISFCLSKHFLESDVFVSFLLTASL